MIQFCCHAMLYYFASGNVDVDYGMHNGKEIYTPIVHAKRDGRDVVCNFNICPFCGAKVKIVVGNNEVDE